MAERAIMLPFSITAYGSVGSTSDQSKIWADRVRTVLGTASRERLMLTRFGTLIPYALFENPDEAEAEIRGEVEKAFNTQLTLLQLTSVDVTIDTFTNIMNILVVYGLPNGEQVETNVGIVSLNCDTPLIEAPL
jgi:phage baseplate assembly protein W